MEVLRHEKDVKPISARKMGELARLLEERGVDDDIVQTRMIENPDGLCFFLRGRLLGAHFGKTITTEEKRGLIIEIQEISLTLRPVVGIARSIYDYCLGNIIRIGDEVIYDNGTKGGTKGKVIMIDISPRIIITSDDYHCSLDDIICIELLSNSDWTWASLRSLGF